MTVILAKFKDGSERRIEVKSPITPPEGGHPPDVEKALDEAKALLGEDAKKVVFWSFEEDF
jgi:hypothetical protein